MWVPLDFNDSQGDTPRTFNCIYLCQNRVHMTDGSGTLKVMSALQSYNE